MHTFILPFSQIRLTDIAKVGGKNASLGELFNTLAPKGIRVPDGFAVTADAYWFFLEKNGIRTKLEQILKGLDRRQFSNLAAVGEAARALILAAPMPQELQAAILQAYRLLGARERNVSVAVRSSATAEDLPSASFAGQLESFLNVSGGEEVVRTVHRCFTSLFTNRAIKYREDQGFGQSGIGLSVGVQRMVRSDKASSGVAFTLHPDSGFDKVIVIDGIWGLGENIVQGRSTPDEFIVFKPTLELGKQAIISKKQGRKEWTMVFSKKTGDDGFSKVLNKKTPVPQRTRWVLSDPEVTTLAHWCQSIEDHYGKPMDIEWAKDGNDGKLYIVQARPETVHSKTESHRIIHSYKLKSKGKLLTKGIALGDSIAAGRAVILNSPAEAHKLKPGDVLVTDITNPDWDPIMKKAAAIVTNKGGRTSHAAIVARELGVVAVVGTRNATQAIAEGSEVTVCCAEGAEGRIYEGKATWETHDFDTATLELPKRTEAMLILGEPDRAFQLSFLPNRGVGLMRLEFIISNSVQIHPLALTRYEQLKSSTARQKIDRLTKVYERREDYFVDKLSQAIAMIAAAFHPNDVIVRMSDFKSNEYANLIGGHQFEPEEENPMLGFRGASRYYSPLYRDGFELECRAMLRVRNDMGLTNVKLMIPFCRTVEEGRQALKTMEEFGLRRGENGLEVYVMVEIPSNVLLAEQFADLFDGFSIGSNDLTQLTLGLDRDSSLVSGLFNEQNPAVKILIASAIRSARKKGIKIGLCGQAPSDFPGFAQFLVEEGIHSISFNPDALIKGIENIVIAEKKSVAVRLVEPAFA